MRAIVLAGGLGSRLAPLTDHLPKPLLPVLNYPIMGHVISGLRDAGIREIGVIIGPHADMIRRYFGRGEPLDVRLTWLVDHHGVMGTGGSLRDHAHYFRGEPVLVVCADMLSNLDYREVIRHHNEHPATVTVAAHHVDLASWPGDIIHADGTTGLGYQFKPGPDQAASDLGSTGTWIVHPDILNELPHEGFVDFSGDVLPRLPAARHSLGVYDAGHIQLHDFGEYDRYLLGTGEALDGNHSILPHGTLIGPSIWAEEPHEIHPSARLTGPTAIGRHVTVGPDVTITGPTVIGHGASLEGGAQIHASVVLPGATIPEEVLLANAVAGNPGRVADHLAPWPTDP